MEVKRKWLREEVLIKRDSIFVVKDAAG